MRMRVRAAAGPSPPTRMLQKNAELPRFVWVATPPYVLFSAHGFAIEVIRPRQL